MAKVLTKNLQIVCLANSRKLSGRCVAGKLLDGSGQWVRSVSAREHEEVSLDERRYDNGEDPLLRDVLNLCVLENRGHAYQSENWLLDDKFYWTKARRLKWKQLAGLEDEPTRLWINGQHTMHGHNDQIALGEAQELTDSLRLIRVPELVIRAFRPSARWKQQAQATGKIQVSGSELPLDGD